MAALPDAPAQATRQMARVASTMVANLVGPPPLSWPPATLPSTQAGTLFPTDGPRTSAVCVYNWLAQCNPFSHETDLPRCRARAVGSMAGSRRALMFRAEHERLGELSHVGAMFRAEHLAGLFAPADA